MYTISLSPKPLSLRVPEDTVFRAIVLGKEPVDVRRVMASSIGNEERHQLCQDFFLKKNRFQETTFSAAMKYIYYYIYTIYTLNFFSVLFVERLHTRRGIIGGRV
jgi:hypothetical protein